MKRLILLLVIAVSCFGQVSNIQFPCLSDPDETGQNYTGCSITFDVDQAYTGVRLRIGKNGADVDAGQAVGANIEVRSYDPGGSGYDRAMTLQFAGLTSNMAHKIAPEVLIGGVWSTGIQATFTTDPEPATTPVLPRATTSFSTTLPNLAGYTVTTASSCADVQTKVTAAVANRPSAGQIVVQPVSLGDCEDHWEVPIGPEVHTIAAGDVVSSTCTITWTGHGLADNAEIRFAIPADGNLTSSLPGGYPVSLINGQTSNTGEIIQGYSYFVYYVDADHFRVRKTSGGDPVNCGYATFTADAGANTISIPPGERFPNGVYWWQSDDYAIQLKSTGTLPAPLQPDTNYFPTVVNTVVCPVCVTGLSLTSGGAAINITDAGTGTHMIVGRGHGTMYVTPWPGSTNEIIITGDEYATPGSLPDPGKRMNGPLYEDHMPTLRQAAGYSSYPYYNARVILAPLTHHVRFLGVKFDIPEIALPMTTTDPLPAEHMFFANNSAGHIIFDRVYSNLRGYPNGRAGYIQYLFSGKEMAIIDSDMMHMDLWRISHSGLEVTRTNDTTVSVATGSLNGGDELFSVTATTPSTLVISDGAGSNVSGARVYASLTGVLTAQLPTGVVASWTACGTGWPSCAVTNSGTSTVIPVNGDGRRTGCPLGTITFSSGNVASAAVSYCGEVLQADGSPINNGIPDGASGILAGESPGPNLLINNHLHGAGLLAHYSECSPFRSSENFVVQRNFFDTPASANPGDATFDGLTRWNRQQLENKCGKYVDTDGNIFGRQYTEKTPASVAVANTAREKGTSADYSFTNNWILQSNGGHDFPVYTFDDHQTPKVFRRFLFDNNTVVARNTQKSPGANAFGWLLHTSGAAQDITIKRTLYYLPDGLIPHIWHHENQQLGAVSMKNNIFAYATTGAFGASSNPACGNGGSTIDEAFLDCTVPRGYTLDATNILVPGWTSPEATPPSGTINSTTVAGRFPTKPVQVVNAGSTVANWNSIIPTANAALYRFKIPTGNAYLTACGGGLCGPDTEEQMDHIGLVRDIVLTPAATSIAVSLKAPSTAPVCIYVGASSTTCASLTWTNSSSAGTRTTTISGLTPDTVYPLRIVAHFDQTSDMFLNGDQLSAQSVITSDDGSVTKTKFIPNKTKLSRYKIQ